MLVQINRPKESYTNDRNAIIKFKLVDCRTHLLVFNAVIARGEKMTALVDVATTERERPNPSERLLNTTFPTSGFHPLP